MDFTRTQANSKRPLQSGDIVVLASGGPQMTVTALSSAASVLVCMWFTDDKILQRAAFERDCLVAAKDDQ